jgi:protein TonB
VAPVRRLSALPISILVHVLVVLALVVIPLLATDVLPIPRSGGVEWESIVPTVPEPPRPPTLKASQAAPVPEVNPDAAPSSAPQGISDETGIQHAAPTDEMLRLERGVVMGDDVGAGVARTEIDAPPPPSPAAPVRLWAGIREPRKVVDVQPVYPEMARVAKIEGLVIIEATIGLDGTVQDARVLRSRPMLDEAALAAVRQWRYTPTLLNGSPVRVIITVTVNFTLR